MQAASGRDSGNGSKVGRSMAAVWATSGGDAGAAGQAAKGGGAGRMPMAAAWVASGGDARAAASSQ